MRIITLLTCFLFIAFFAHAQDNKTICVQLNELNTAVVNGSIKRADAAKTFKTLILQLYLEPHKALRCT